MQRPMNLPMMMNFVSDEDTKPAVTPAPVGFSCFLKKKCLFNSTYVATNLIETSYIVLDDVKKKKTKKKSF